MTMLTLFRQMFSDAASNPDAGAAIPPGQRVYAIGDIHGRRDLFEKLIEAIEEDDRMAGPADTTVVLLGDLVDRGADPAGVVSLARQWQERRRVRILAGNHEEMFLRAFEDEEALRHFLRYGGRETVLSYGLDQEVYRSGAIGEVRRMMNETVPADVREFIAGLEDMIVIGDYLFVHAGIDPTTPLEDQKVETLRWIREPFLSHDEPYEHVVVHGHSITGDADDRGNRIGIDTGAYASGKLTALALEGTQRRYLQAVMGEDGTITAGPREIAA